MDCNDAQHTSGAGPSDGHAAAVGSPDRSDPPVALHVVRACDTDGQNLRPSTATRWRYLSRRTSAVDKRQEVQIDAVALQKYDEWLAAHMEELEDLHTIL